MKNPLVEGYVTLDNTIMKGINAGVKAYNWTTGRTKANLASKLLSTGVIMMSAGMFAGTKIGGAILTPLLMWGAHSQQVAQGEVEEREISALEKGLLDPAAESYKLSCKITAPFFFPIGLLAAARGLEIEPGNYDEDMKRIGFFLTGASMLPSSLSFYVMRADYHPPRKNVLSRAKDRLTELVQSYTPKPEPSLA